MSNAFKGFLIKKLALLIDVGVPLAVTVSQFPVWVERSSEATVSGVFVVFALLSCIPFLRRIKAFLKSPSAPVVWTLLFFFLVALNSIIDEAVFIAFYGACANLLGALLNRLACIIERR